ncbi:unnamed protein product [Albugo candida]|uniref:Uncharacterized protein n=1 Tax=Albugo candida TaxID=65357 RepID=A0A024GUH6_9STRA|nr:unnamed protein product [Albugo candida]|eukprot:CCI50000.1 unnamed protein product [Albugo candida]
MKLMLRLTPQVTEGDKIDRKNAPITTRKIAQNRIFFCRLNVDPCNTTPPIELKTLFKANFVEHFYCPYRNQPSKNPCVRKYYEPNSLIHSRQCIRTKTSRKLSVHIEALRSVVDS